MRLHTLKSPAPNNKTRKRVGRGEGSGLGQQSGRGNNGQKSRSGASIPAGFEGGQMPLQRRLPKFGFKNRFRKEYRGLNLAKIQDFIDRGKLTAEISFNDLVVNRLAAKGEFVKILGNGELKQAIRVEAHGITKSANEKLEKAGGSVSLLS